MDAHQDDAIDPSVLAFFVREIRKQCEFGLYAFNATVSSIRNGSIDETFFFAHSFLTHAALASRCLSSRNNGVKKHEKASLGADKVDRLANLRTNRGSRIWQELGLGDSSIVTNHTLRDHLEHFDERLEVWLVSSPNRNFADMNIASAGGIVGLDPGDYQRNLNPETLHFSFQGEDFDLHELALELKKIGEAAARWQTHRDRRARW